MTNEELKQRLIELLDGYYEETGVGFVHYLTDEECEMIADHLIANGVTIRERGEWSGGSWDYKGNYMKECTKCHNSSTEYGSDFCPNCGVDMRDGKDK